MFLSLLPAGLVLACLGSGSGITGNGSPGSEKALTDGHGISDALQQLTGHNTMLQQLHAAVEDHDQLLHDAYSLIRQQAEQLNRQQHLLNQHTAELRQQQYVLNHQEEMLNQLSPWGAPESEWEQHAVETRSYEFAPLQAALEQMGQQLTQVQADMHELYSASQHSTSTQGTTFVHWGNNQCPNISQVVYSGVVGGAHGSHAGGGTNYLCLTMSPIFSDRPLPAAASYLYGSEYETYDEHENKDPVCAVCRSEGFSSTIMIPGTNVCTAGWQLQYSGFLMAGYVGHPAGSEFICVDSTMQSRIGGDASYDGKLIFYTVTRCGSLPCEPYAENKIVTCAVCSR